MSSQWAFEVERHFSVLHVDLFLEALKAEWYRSVYGLEYSCSYYKIVDGREYWRAVDYPKYAEVLASAHERIPNFLDRFTNQTQKMCDTAAESARRLTTKSVQGLTDKALTDEWLAYSSGLLGVCTAINGRPVEFIEEHLYPILEKLLTRVAVTTLPDDLVAIIANVDRPLAYRDEPLDLLRIGAAIQANPADLQRLLEIVANEDALAQLSSPARQLIETHRGQYSWLNHPYAAHRTPFAAADYVGRLRHLVISFSCRDEVIRIEDQRRHDKTVYEELLRAVDDDREASILRSARSFAFLRTYMAEVFDKALVTARETVLAEIGRRLHLSDAQVVSMTQHEIATSVMTGLPSIDPQELDSRAEAYAYLLEDGHKTLVTGDAIRMYYEEEGEDVGVEGEAHVSSVSGMVANTGIATGPAKILLSPADNPKVNAGDIIVATMTTPEYIAAMEKAAAFVTDEGGITCHAAITSREFNVPCIVGTGIATRVFKDNDVICVDTDGRVVYKL